MAEQLDPAQLRQEQDQEIAQLRIDEAKKRIAEAEKQTQKTTLDEYIIATHNLVFIHFDVETDKRLTSKDFITNLRDKLYPTYLQPWDNFREQQSETLEKLYSTFPTTERLFESQNALNAIGQKISERPILNEKTLEYFLLDSIEYPVREIFDRLRDVDKIRREFNIGDSIIFENYPNAISETSDEVVERQAQSTLIRPDEICVYRATSDGQLSRRTMLYVSEYKAPHKLTAPHFRAGLRRMDIFNDVINRKKIPTAAAEPEARFQYHAERLITAAISQIYNYIIEGGLDYGILTNGEAIVFLKVDWQNPETLLYHLAEPIPEVTASPPDDRQFYTAVCQYLAFSLMALGPPGGEELQSRPQEERQRAIDGLKTWAEDFETTLRSIPPDERTPPPGSPYTAGKDSRLEPLRKKARLGHVGDSHHADQPRRGNSDDKSSESLHQMPDSPSTSELRGARRSKRILAQRQRGGGGGKQGRQYCTQQCLLGLVRNGRLDKYCPNVALHCQGTQPPPPQPLPPQPPPPQGLPHPISHGEFLRLLSEQLKKSLDYGVTRLGLQGSRGALFQVTLLAYGYTFVSKATVPAFISDFQHEEKVYRLLKEEQGANIPVFLGTIDLRELDKIYYYDYRVYIKYMIFLSWGGNIDSSVTTEEVRRCLDIIYRAGVVHGDVRWANMLRDPQTRRVIIIDFERSSITKPPQLTCENEIGFYDDILAAAAEFPSRDHKREIVGANSSALGEGPVGLRRRGQPGGP
ncbi:hypothetical protein F5B20DRAFT_531207 [Whalleya microplaca]|nr:hypothetical protein F5B20DRAFT_531207 [Whalleya microplaca]